jgi:hypothetical protein
MYKNTIGTEGLFTFNFFCESIIGAMHTLHHVMEEASVEEPKDFFQLADAFSDIGKNLLTDYEQKQLDMDRIKKEIFDFYTLSYKINDELTPIVAKGDNKIQYYYFVFEQGLKVMFPALWDNLVDDLPEEADAEMAPFIENMMAEFAELAAK